MIAALFAAASIASTPPAAPPPKEPTVAELKAENAQLKTQGAQMQDKLRLLAGLVNELRAQRNQSADLVADLAARYDAVSAGAGQARPAQ